MAILRVSKRFVELLQSGQGDYIEAKIRLSREWYSAIRFLESELSEIDMRISECYACDDDYAERQIILLELEYYRNLLILFGFDPCHDSEIEG